MSNLARDRTRQSIGQPTGGQFAEEARSGSGLSLTDAEFDDHLGELYEYLDERSRFAHRSQTFGSTWDREDLRQDAMLEMVDRARRTGSVADVTKGYARHYQAGLVTRALQARREGRDASEHLKVNSANMAGWRTFAARVDDLERELDRSLTNHERDAVAARVRDEWPDQRHRPSINFHRSRQTQALPEEDWETGRPVTASAETSYFDSLAGGGEEVERVMTMPSRGGAARKFGWNAMCEIRGIPKAPQGFLNNRQIAYCKDQVGDENAAVISTLRAWQSGTRDEQTECLFRPFGAVDNAHREQIADLLEDYPDDAHRIYTMALAGATKRNFTGRAAAASKEVEQA